MSELNRKRSSLLDEIESEAARPETRSRAIDLAIRAYGGGREDALVLTLIGEGLEGDGRLVDAAAVAHRATVLYPDQVDAWTKLSERLLLLDRRAEAAEAANSAAKLEPDSYAARMTAATAFLNLNAFPEAAEHAEHAARLRPLAAEPLSLLAILNARLSRFSDARDLAERALRLRLSLPGAEIALAKVEMAEHCHDLAISRLRRVLAHPTLVSGHRSEALSVLGDALDSAGEPAKAFAAYAASNAVIARQANARQPRRRAVDHAADMERYFSVTTADPWRRCAPGGATSEAAGHVFLIGFPRSGTTLLENALALHPSVLALEETDALSLCAGDLMADAAALDRLVNLDAAAADDCRSIYWRRAGELLGQPLAGRTIVDKLPIGTVALPVIAKLFPGAKILFARRDPRDVVLSCFRRLFGDNEVMAEFLTLDSAASYYTQVMRLAALYEDKLALAMHVIRHEDVVADFDGCLAGALAYIGLDWNSAVRNFADRAIRARTPSATQLAGGLNANGVGAWRRFEQQMAPVAALLEPWAARFGYPPAGPAPRDERFAPIRADIGRSLAAGDWAAVFAKTDQAFAGGFSDEMLYRFRGVRAQQEGRLDSAVADFDVAVSHSAGDIGLLSAIGLCLARLGRGGEAVARLDEAIALQPDFAPAHFNRGFALEGLGDVVSASAAYVRAASLDPRHAAALGSLAVLASRRGDWGEARDFAGRALAVRPRLASASLAMAKAEAAEGEGSRAERRLRLLLAQDSSANAHERAVAQSALGDVLDALDRPEQAFASYLEAGRGLRSIYAPRFEASGVERASHLIERLAAWFEAADPAAWDTDPALDLSAAPAFLLGFPRSGTTLLGQALGLHSGLFTVDEKDTLAESIAAFFAAESGMKDLERLTMTAAEPLRDGYFARARAHGWPGGDARLIDKLPTNTMALPIIAKLFPAAKILVMRRDPRDVVLSCFRRQFVINPTTIEFLSLESAARLYDATMRLYDLYQSRLHLQVRIQGHEDLVADFEGEMKAILAFLDLPWEPSVADFAARGAWVATPSSAQLAGGLSAEGVGAWRRYRRELEPVLPTLAPWVERFGYSPD
ncbi:MAG: sulfotransferase [Caulobacteraceae bacterium]